MQCVALLAILSVALQDAPAPAAKPPVAPPAPPPAQPAPSAVPAPSPAPELKPPPDAEAIDAAIRAGIATLVARQDRSEWPYEGVYRVRGEIPLGYRVGGTSIVAQALLEAPGFADDEARRHAVDLACNFVCGAIDDPLLSPSPAVYKGGYDVRGWAHCYGLRFLVALERAKAIPKGSEESVAKAISFYLDALQSTEIPESGGWTYSRKPGLETPCASAPFMTAPCVMALIEARSAGHAVKEDTLRRALAALERARGDSGYVAYGVMGPTRDVPGQIPGSIGRMVATESALTLAGRGAPARLKAAVDAFLQYWPDLEKRRKKQGTHLPPYNVAPYYFFYGFHHAALAIELLPEAERPPFRAKLAQILMTLRDDDGTWNDRVFARSACYGTAMAVTALLMPSMPLAAPRPAAEPAKAPVTPSAPATSGS